MRFSFVTFVFSVSMYTLEFHFSFVENRRIVQIKAYCYAIHYKERRYTSALPRLSTCQDIRQLRSITRAYFKSVCSEASTTTVNTLPPFIPT